MYYRHVLKRRLWPFQWSVIAMSGDISFSFISLFSSRLQTCLKTNVITHISFSSVVCQRSKFLQCVTEDEVVSCLNRGGSFATPQLFWIAHGVFCFH